MAKKKQESIIDHIVTEEDLANNPDLVAAGIKVGETIGLPAIIQKKEKGFAVFSPQQGYIRTYTESVHGKDAEKLAKEYAEKIGGTVEED